jgi:hypothetical protein
MFIPVPDPGFFSIPDLDPGSRNQKCAGSWISDPGSGSATLVVPESILQIRDRFLNHSSHFTRNILREEKTLAIWITTDSIGLVRSCFLEYVRAVRVIPRP